MLLGRARINAARVAVAVLLASLMGCSGLGSAARAPVVSNGTAPTRAQRSASPAGSQAAPFGDFGEPASAAKPETPEVVRTSAWSKLKDAIGRPSPQPIPLRAAESGPATDEERPFTTVDGRDF